MEIGELQKIIEAAELANSNLHIEEVLKNIVKVATELTNADRGTLYLVDKEKNELWSLIAMGSETQEIRLSIGEGLAGFVAQSGETINLNDVTTDSRFNSSIDQKTGYITRNMICFPIKDKHNSIIGVLQLLNSLNGFFSNRDESFLNALSIHSAIAINNALMHQKQISINEELKKAYSDLEVAKQEAEKFAMLKTHFLSQMSHEIRTPLNIVSGSIQLLKYELQPQHSEDIDSAIEMLEKGSARIIRTIDEIIEMSKIRSGNYEITLELIQLSKEIIKPIIHNFTGIAECKNINLVYLNTCAEDTITADRFMVYQIFQELIDNAIKFTDKGMVIVRQNRNPAGQISVCVKDTGIGISEEYLKHIFEPFTQEQTGYTRKYDGNGLALTLVKKYAELNKLTLTVESTKNVGSEFTITFN